MGFRSKSLGPKKKKVDIASEFPPMSLPIYKRRYFDELYKFRLVCGQTARPVNVSGAYVNKTRLPNVQLSFSELPRCVPSRPHRKLTTPFDRYLYHWFSLDSAAPINRPCPRARHVGRRNARATSPRSFRSTPHTHRRQTCAFDINVMPYNKNDPTG